MQSPQNTAAACTTRRTKVTPRWVVIDMMSTWRFPDADKLLPGVLAIAPVIARLRSRCKRAGMPVIYANDNDGRWRSDWRQLMASVLEAGGGGAQIASQLAPEDDDYFVLKPMQSAFFGTPLQLLLQHLRVRRLVLTGVSSDQCVLTTATTAKMHGYDVEVPCDAVATQSAARNRAAILHMGSVQKLTTTPASRLRFLAKRASERPE